MAQWIGEKVTLRAGPALNHEPDNSVAATVDVEGADECQRPEYKETYVTEYDGVQVYLQQGSYECKQKVHTWSFYEYKMWINGECWNIIMNGDMKNPPDWTYPGSNSAKLSHDFCHLNTDASDEVYTNFHFVEMGGRKIWPFYSADDFQEDLWIWVSPRRFAVITNHKHNEKLNHFYVDRMHEHNVLANRMVCWFCTELTNLSGKVTDKQIALSRESRCGTAEHENFQTGCEHKVAIKIQSRKDEQLHGKRKFSDSSGQLSARIFDPSGSYSARDLQKLSATFAEQASLKPSTSGPSHTTSKVTLWRHGEVPSIGPTTDGRARATKQLEYARTLLAVVVEAAAQMEEVVNNLVQIEEEHAGNKEEEQGPVDSATPAASQAEVVQVDPQA